VLKCKEKCAIRAEAESVSILGGTAEEAAEKLIPDNKVRPQRLTPNSKQCTYRSTGSAAPPKITCNIEFFRSL
jgi:hypothetical protein